ncbi:MAG TPA: ABC transporter ATP-binding protein, partial [bacterium]|nr:ABC transporter ATP-binding protein [bacterium]
MALLEVDNLHTHFATAEGVARAVDGVSFSIAEGQSLALVGESACGKTVTALSLLRLIRAPGYHPAGSIGFEGQELLGLPEDELRRLRGNRMAMIFQEPLTALNPVFTVANQVTEPLMLHQGLSSGQAWSQCRDLLGQMGIAAPEVVLESYPHQLSGGMRQRVMIAMAMACRPKLMIADEPTTALDVTVQAQILYLLKELQREYGMSLLLITHDLGIVNQVCERTCVMYAGRIAESAGTADLLAQPCHPYSERLLRSLPRDVPRGQRLQVIPGTVAPATSYEPGCRFAPRCSQ